jgi:hypothetical protein
MAFDPIPAIEPQDIGTLRVALESIKDPDGRRYGASYHLLVEMSDGSVKRLDGNLVEHMTTEQRDWLIGLLDGLVAQARERILGTA